MPPFQSPHTMIREDLVRIVLAGLKETSVWSRPSNALTRPRVAS